MTDLLNSIIKYVFAGYIHVLRPPSHDQRIFDGLHGHDDLLFSVAGSPRIHMVVGFYRTSLGHSRHIVTLDRLTDHMDRPQEKQRYPLNCSHEFREPQSISTSGSYPCSHQVPYPRFVEHYPVSCINSLRAPTIIVRPSFTQTITEQCKALRSLAASIVVLEIVNIAIGSLSG